MNSVIEGGRVGYNYSTEGLYNNREVVLKSYEISEIKNRDAYLNGDIRCDSRYIHDNQKEDATVITNTFYTNPIRVVSIVKRTKVGMDGLMIEIAKNMSTHPDDNFVTRHENIFILTGMSNVLWENEMKTKTPECFRDNIYHHGQIQKSLLKLKDITNAIIIIDEIDTGDQEGQKLHKLLIDSNLLDMDYMEKSNIRFIFVSATMVNELRELYRWGDKHYTHYMIIPDEYIGHKDFVEAGIIQEFYAINSIETAERWVVRDIIENYGTDYRVHIIRTDNKNYGYIRNACIMHKINFDNHTSTERISDERLAEIFNNLNNHIVIAVKGFYRRANLIPNEWKKKIGSTHEKYVKKYDTNVQVQGLPGRMSGYWRTVIENGHKTGPHRTSLNAMKEYESFYESPLGLNNYKTATKKLFVARKNIKNLKFVNDDNNDDDNNDKNEFMRFPVVLNITKDEIELLAEEKKSCKRTLIFNIVKNIDKKLYKYITTECVECLQITTPKTEGSYKKHILDIIKKNKPCSIDLKKEQKDINNWQVFIDNKGNRLCFVLWVVDELLY
jgi:hypothetical protein